MKIQIDERQARKGGEGERKVFEQNFSRLRFPLCRIYTGVFLPFLSICSIFEETTFCKGLDKGSDNLIFLWRLTFN